MGIEFPAPLAGQPYSYPLAHPHPDAKPHPPRAALTSVQQATLDKVVAIFNADDFAVPNTIEELKLIWRIRAGPAKGLSSFWAGKAPTKDQMPPVHPLTDDEKCYWSIEAFQRCARAVRWSEEAVIKRCEETLVWRRDFPANLPAERVSREGETGKELVFGYDNDCRPVLYMHPYRQNTETSDDQLRFVVWCLERTIDLCPPTEIPTEMLCLCIDFGANRNEKRPPTSIGQAKKVLTILQTYYCERLGRALCANVPGYFASFYSLLSPFIDPITREKVKFLNGGDATAFVPPSQLQSMFDGEVDFQYNHEEYFPALDKLCAERRAANLERWKKYGAGKCGLSEAVIRGALTLDGQPGDAVIKKGEIGTGQATEESNKPTDEVNGVAGLSIKDDQPAPSNKDDQPALSTKDTATEADATSAPSPAKEAHTASAPGAVPAVEESLTGLAPPLETPGDEQSFALAPEASEEAVEAAVEPVKTAEAEGE